MTRKELNDFAKVCVALQNLQEAVLQCEDVFMQVDEGKLNDYIAQDYPFDLDFESMSIKIAEWCKSSRLRIHNPCTEK